MKTESSLRNRLLIAGIIIPVLLVFSWLGGWFFAALIAIVTAIAAYELWALFHSNGYKPALGLMLVFTPLAVLLRKLTAFQYSDIFFALLIISTMIHHVITAKNVATTSAASYFVTLGGPIYIGWLGSYAVSLENLDNGFFWLLLVLIIIAMADTGAYVLGSQFGRYKMFPQISPKKSWEGYVGGILTGALVGVGVAALWHIFTPVILPIHGLILGLAISILAPLGDFGESLIKRSFNVKDSSTILLDHGGFLDRIDSALWAVTIGYYLVIFLFA